MLVLWFKESLETTTTEHVFVLPVPFIPRIGYFLRYRMFVLARSDFRVGGPKTSCKDVEVTALLQFGGLIGFPFRFTRPTMSL